MSDQLKILIAFLRHEIGEDKLPMTRDTLIEDDLGVSGDDAEDLIIAFGKAFNVDVSNFNLGAYFGDEPGGFLIWWRKPRELKPFTIGHLEKAMLAGRLDDTVINS